MNLPIITPANGSSVYMVWYVPTPKLIILQQQQGFLFIWILIPVTTQQFANVSIVKECYVVFCFFIFFFFINAFNVVEHPQSKLVPVITCTIAASVHPPPPFLTLIRWNIQSRLSCSLHAQKKTSEQVKIFWILSNPI